jgi:glycosyltransferase involved in cell wall biosynthesis
MSASTPPRVSILVPTRNRAGWLRESIAAALAQTFENFELLIADNASTDETADVVASSNDPRVRYVRRPADVGLVENHNAGLASIDSDYVIIVPDDDLMYPRLLERTVPILERMPRVGMVHTSIDMLDSDGAIIAGDVNWTMGLTQDTVEPGETFIREQMKHSCRVCASTALMRTSALPLGYFDPGDYPPVDLGFWLRMATQWNMAFLDETLGGYRIHDHSHSAAVGTRSEQGYVRDVTLMRRQHEVKLRFVEENVTDEAEARRLRRLAKTGKRNELVTSVRQRTVPARRFRETLAAAVEAAREEPRVLTDYRIWRLIGASALGGRLTNRLLQRRRGRRKALQ